MGRTAVGSPERQGPGLWGPRPTLAWIGLVALGLCGVAVVLLATPWGAGLGGDSYYYVSGARNLVAGLGFSRPAADGGVRLITHYPPGYSAVLAALTALGPDTLIAARWLDAGLFGANIVLLGFMVYRATRSAAPAWLASLLALGSPALLVVHTWVLSEPLFLTLTLLALIALGASVDEGRSWMIVAAGLMAGLAYLTRYVGLALIASGGLALLVFSAGSPLRRLGKAAAFGAIAALGPAAWAVRNLGVGGTVAYAAAQLHPPSLARLTEAGATISLWLLPSRVPFSLRIVATVLALAYLAFAAWYLLVRGGNEKQQGRVRSQVGVLVCLAVVYPISILGALTLVGSSIPLDDRILSPLLVTALSLGVLSAWALFFGARRGDLLRGGLALAALGFAALMLVRGAGTVARLRIDGQGTAARAWQESELVDWVRRLPEGTPLYSNELDALYLYTDRQAYQVPIRWDPVVEAPRDDYEAQLAAMRHRLADQEAVLVLFDTIATQSAFLPSRAELTEGLFEVFRASDGAAYAASPSGPWSWIRLARPDTVSQPFVLVRDGRHGLE